MIGLDTNLLVHAHQREATLHKEAVEAVRGLAESPVPWAVCFNCLIEFYGVVTQPKLWRQSSTSREATGQVEAWLESPSLRLVSDTVAEWRILSRLLTKAKVGGSQVHDARIAACYLTHGVTEIWTVDRDFSRFPEIRVRNPLV